MKRSEINGIVKDAISFFENMNFILPPFAHFTMEDWRDCHDNYKEIPDVNLGWDITDFGSNNFKSEGLLLFTLRNGKPGHSIYKKSYAEKIMIIREDQYTPMHYHWNKMEDIINRGGGNLLIRFFRADEDDKLSQEELTISFDGIEKAVKAGETIVIGPGESVTIPQGVFHTFWGEKGKGPVLTGEVSMVNDDSSDNNFYDSVGRFPVIEEDEEPYRLLVSDYGRIVPH